MKIVRLALLCSLAVFLSGCVADMPFNQSGVQTFPVRFGDDNSVADSSVQATKSTAPQEASRVSDPLAPNWSIRERRQGNQLFFLSLKADVFREGGDGESLTIVRRRALQLQQTHGYKHYQIRDYSESVINGFPYAYRVAQATIELM